MGWAAEPNSFKKVYDYLRRRGKQIEPLFFPDELSEYIHIRDSFRSIFEEVLEGKKQSIVIKRQAFDQICNDYLTPERIRKVFPDNGTNNSFDINKIRQLMHILSDEKKDRIYCKLSSIASGISKDGIAWKLDPTIRTKKGKDVYSLDHTDIGSCFMSRVIQQSIKERYRIVMNNRSTIIKQILELITMNSPFSIIRTDIQGFFESVPHDDLVNLLEESKLPQSQIVAICDLLEKCSRKFGNNGLPRGIGLSSYLAELYLLDFDRSVKELDSVIYYNRYVDDIIVVVTEDSYDTKNNATLVKNEMIKHISSKKLSFHSGGTKDFTISNPSQSNNKPISFEYLGYQFLLMNNSVTMEISLSKIDKYKERINYAAWSYWNTPSMNCKDRNQLFVDRIRFLAMRTRLNYDKKNVLTGLPSRYPLINRNSNSLTILDDYLTTICKKMPTQIRCSVGPKISFRNGFVSEKVLKFNESRLKEITRIWKSL